MHNRREPVNAAEVNGEVYHLVQRCNDLLREYHGAGSEYVTTRDVYETAYAREILLAEGTVQEKKAKADGKCKAEYLKFIQAETKYKYLKLAIDTTRDQLTALESIGSNLRAEAGLNKYAT